MTISDKDLIQAFDDLFLSSVHRTLLPARLGVAIDSTPTYDVGVPGRLEYVYISLGPNGEEGQTTAKDKVGVDRTVAWQRIWVRKEGREYVIREATYLANDVLTVSLSLDELTDVATTGAAGGDFLAFDGSTLSWYPFTPSAEGVVALHALSDTAYHSGQLADSQFLNALLRDGSRSITGNLSVAVGITIDGIDISAHAADPNAHHDEATSGNAGISVTGQAISLVLATDPGLELSGGVRVKLPSNSGLLRDSTGLYVNPTIAGAGLVMTTGVIDVVAANGSLTVGSNNMNVNLAHNWVWSGSHTFNTGVITFNTDPQVGANLDFIGADRLITNASGDITVSPTGDLFLNPSGLIQFGVDKEMRSDAIQDLPTGINGFRLWERTDAVNYYQLTIGALKADEMYVRVFVADEVRIDRGEEYWSKSFGIVETDFALPADEGNINVWFENSPGLAEANLFSVGDWLLLRSIDWGTGLAVYKMWFQVLLLHTSGAGDVRQRWTLKRKFGGPAAGYIVKKGNLFLDVGVEGQGWIHLSALSQDGGPFIQLGLFDAVVSGEPTFVNRVRVGHLDGVAGLSGTYWGLAAGNDLSLNPNAGLFSGFTTTDVDGLKLYNTDITLFDTGDVIAEITQSEGITLLQDSGLLDNAYTGINWYENVETKAGSHSFITSYKTVGGVTMAMAAVEEDASPSTLSLSAQSSVGSTAGISLITNLGASLFHGTMSLSLLSGTGIRASHTFQPLTDNAIDLGTASLRWRAIYVDQLNAGTISGATLSGSEWEFFGSMVIDANSASNTLVSVANQGTGRADLNVDRDIIVGGTVDGVDISAFNSDFNVHTGNSQIHVGAGTAGAGLAHASGVLSVNAATGLTISGDNVILASSVAGTGLDYTAGVLSLETTLGGLGLTYSAGVLSIDPTLAGEGLVYASGVMDLDSAIAGSGLTYTAGIISINIQSDGGLEAGGDDLGIKLGNSGSAGLHLDSTGVWFHRRGDLGLNSGLSMTIVDGVWIADGVAGDGLLWDSADERILKVGTSTSIGVTANTVFVQLATASGLNTTSGLAITPGLGIELVSNQVRIDLATNSGLNITSGLAVDASLAGTGLTLTAGVLSVNTTNGITTSGDNIILHPDVAGAGLNYTAGVLDVVATNSSLTVLAGSVHVNLAHNFVWSGNHTFNTGTTTFNTTPQINANLNFSGSARTITSAAGLSINPTGDLTLNPSGLVLFATSQEMRSATFSDLVTGIDGFRLFERSDVANYYQLTIGAFKADELYVRVFVADEVRVDRGEEYWSKSFGIIETDVALPADETNFNVWFENAPGLAAANLFTVGDWLLLRAIDWDTGLAVYKIWFTVVALITSGSVDGYRQRWTLKRESGGVTGIMLKKGMVMLDAGQVGQGWIHLSALSQDGGPFIQIGDMTSIVSSDTPAFTNRVRMGNLDGVAGLSGTFWGFAAGNSLALTPSTGFSGFTTEATNGMRTYNTSIEMYDGATKIIALNNTNGLALRNSSGSINDKRVISWVADPSAPDYVSSNFSRLANYTSGAENILSIQSRSITDSAWLRLNSTGSNGTAAVDLVGGEFRVDASVGASHGYLRFEQPGKLSIGIPVGVAIASTLHIYEDNSTTGAAAGLTIEQDGTGDAIAQFLLTGGQRWALGIDNSDGDRFKIAANADVGTSPLLTMTTGGIVAVTGTMAMIGSDAFVEPFSGFNAFNNKVLAIRQPTATSGTSPFSTIVMSNNQTDTTNGNVGQFTFMNEAIGSSEKRLGQMMVRTDDAIDNGEYLFRTFLGGVVVENMTLKSSGFVGFGVTSPAYKVDIRPAVASTLTQFHVGYTTTDTGLYLTAISPTLGVVGSVSYNGTNYVAKATSGSMVQFDTGAVVIYANSSLTAATTFTPTEIARFIPTGRMGISDTAPLAMLDISKYDNSDGLRVTSWNGTVATICGRAANGVLGSPSQTGTGVTMAAFVSQARLASTWPSEGVYNTSIRLVTTETQTTTARGSQIEFLTTPNGSSSLTLALEIHQDQLLYALPTYTATVSVVPNLSIDNTGKITRTTHANSSLRYKEEIVYLENEAYQGLFDELKPVTYQLKEGDGKRLVGLIAEDLDVVGGKDFIQYDEEGRPDAILYDRLIVLLISEIRNLKKEVRELQFKNRRLM